MRLRVLSPGSTNVACKRFGKGAQHLAEYSTESGARLPCFIPSFGVSCVSRRCLVSVHLRVRLRACTGQQPSSWLACASASVVVCVVRVGTCTLRGGAGRQGGIQGMRTPQPCARAPAEGCWGPNEPPPTVGGA